LSPGNHSRTARITSPVTSQSISDFIGMLFSVRPEYTNPDEILTKGKDRDAIRVISKGDVVFDFFITQRNLEEMNYMSYWTNYDSDSGIN